MKPMLVQPSLQSMNHQKVFDWTDVELITLGGTDIKSVIDLLTVEYTNGLNSFHGCDGEAEPSALYVENSEVSGSFVAFLTLPLTRLKTISKISRNNHW